MRRTLIWTGGAGTTAFNTASNWTNAATGHAANVAPGRADTIELTGSGTITGGGTVATLEITNTGNGFTLEGGTISAAAITDSSALLLGAGETLKSDTITITNSGGNLGYIDVSAGSTLSAIGGALNITANDLFDENTDHYDGGLIIGGGSGPGAAEVNLGTGTLLLGVGTANPPYVLTDGLQIDNGLLTGGVGSEVVIGSDGGAGYGTIAFGTLLLGGALILGSKGGIGTLIAPNAEVSVGVLDIGVNGTANAQLAGRGAGITITGEGAGTGAALIVGGGTTDSAGYSANGTLLLGQGTASVNGAVIIGGEGGTGDVALNGTHLTTTGAVTIGSASGATGLGTLSLAYLSAWTEQGSVNVGNGTLALNGNATISGNLTVDATGTNAFALLAMAGSSLAVAGTITIGGAPYGAEGPGIGSLRMYESALSAAALILPGGAGEMTISGQYFSPTLNLLPALNVGSLQIGFNVELDLGGWGGGQTTAQIGGTEGSVAVSIEGDLTTNSATTIDVTGAFDLGYETYGFLQMYGGTISIINNGPAFISHSGSAAITSGSVLSATGGIELTDQSTLTIGAAYGGTAGTVNASAAAGQLALSVDKTSMVSDAGTIALQGNALLAGQVSLNQGTFTDNGTIFITTSGTLSGAGSVSGSVTNAGLITASAGTLSFIGAVTGTGTVAIGQAGTLNFSAGVAASIAVAFGPGGTIALADASGFHALIETWATGDVFDLTNIIATTDQVHGNVLTLYNATNHAVASLNFAQPITTSEFTLQPDSHTGALLSFA